MKRLRIGYIPLLDCAPLVVAQVKGFAAEEGLELALTAETSWANIRDRLIVGHFDAAHMLGPMTVASTLGVGHVAVPLVAPFALGLGGNAVTLSTALRKETLRQGAPAYAKGSTEEWTQHARDEGEALRKVVAARARAGLAPLTFGMVYPFSCHNYELRYWLAACGIDPDRDVRLVVIPPPLLVDSMRAGYIDGFCVGEPWNSAAVEAGVGAIVLPTTAIWRHSPEKVLGCRADWAESRPKELAALLRALYRASSWCEQAGHHGELARILAESGYVAASGDLMQRALSGTLVLYGGGPAVPIEDFQVPLRGAATFPWISHALWFYSQMVRWQQTRWSEAQLEMVRRTYRPDLYRSALAPLGVEIPSVDRKLEDGSAGEAAIPSNRGTMTLGRSGFFDGRVFDPSNIAAYLESGDQPS